MATTVRTLDNVRRIIAGLVMVDTGVNRIGIKTIRFDIVDEEKLSYQSSRSQTSLLWHVKYLIHLAPTLAPIFGHLNQTVISSNVD